MSNKLMTNKTPDFTKLSYKGTPPSAAFEDWRKKAGPAAEAVWTTNEQIPVKALYAQSDIAPLRHLDYVPGLPPFSRGPYPSMYVTQPWTVRQYAGFSTAEESNAFYRRNLAAGQKGLSIAFRPGYPPRL